MPNNKYPPHWETSSLGKVCKTSAGGTPLKSKKQYYINGSIPWLRSGEVNKKHVNSSSKYISELGLKNSSAKIFPYNTLLVAMYGATAGQVGILQFECSTNQAVCGIYPNDKIEQEYLYYYLLYFKPVLVSQAVGGAQPNISQEKIKSIPIPIPATIEEQKAIVAKLDKCFEYLDKSLEDTQKQLAHTKELWQSSLNKYLSPEAHWETSSLGDKNILSIIDGDRGQNYPKKNEFFTEEYCLFLSTKNVRKTGFLFEDLQFISKNKDELLRKGKLQINDVIMTTRGTIGNVAWYHDKVPFQHIRINSGMVIFRCNIKLIYPPYLMLLIQSPIIKTQILNKISGTAQPQLPINIINTISIPFPQTIEEQKNIVAKLDAIQENIQKLQHEYTKKN